jgi:hypothetical protein
VAEVKFGQLPPGGRFRWKDAEWLKTSPVLARPVDGEKPVLVPRSARVERLDGDPAQSPTESPDARINLILEDLRHKLRHQLEASSLASDQKKELILHLDHLVEQARDQLKNTVLS